MQFSYISAWISIYTYDVGKTCSARILQWISNLHEGDCVIPEGFVYPLKYPSNAYVLVI